MFILSVSSIGKHFARGGGRITCWFIMSRITAASLVGRFLLLFLIPPLFP